MSLIGSVFDWLLSLWSVSVALALLVHGLLALAVGGLFVRGRYRHRPRTKFPDPARCTPCPEERVVVHHVHHYVHHYVHRFVVSARVEVVQRQALSVPPRAVEAPRVVPGEVISVTPSTRPKGVVS